MIKSYKFRAYPATNKVLKNWETNKRLHCRLYNQAKEERDKNIQHYISVMINNAEILIDKKDEMSDLLKQYLKNKKIQSRINEWYEVNKTMWKREDIPQKDKQQLSKSIKKRINVLEKLAKNKINSKVENHIKKKVKEDKDLTQLPKSIYKYGQYHLIKNNPEYKVCYASALQMTLMRVHNAFQGFFNKQRGYPKFMSYKKWDSITYRQSGYKVDLDKRTVHISRIGKFRVKFHREMVGDIATVTIKEENNKFFVIISCEYESVTSMPKTNKEVGMDVGLKNYIYTSDGYSIKYPFFLEEIQKKLRVLGRKLSRQNIKSKRRKRTKEQIARLHYKVKNKRNNFINEIVDYLAQTYDTIYVEDLNTAKMLSDRYKINSRILRRKISDASWSIFLNKLQNKFQEYGKEIIRVKPQDTSQICCKCGNKSEKFMTISMRVFDCKFCDNKMDVDLNSAINLYNWGKNKNKVLETV